MSQFGHVILRCYSGGPFRYVRTFSIGYLTCLVSHLYMFVNKDLTIYLASPTSCTHFSSDQIIKTLNNLKESFFYSESSGTCNYYVRLFFVCFSFCCSRKQDVILFKNSVYNRNEYFEDSQNP